MQITRKWLGETYEAKVPWGSSDDVEYVGQYAISWNSSLDYFGISMFDKEAWKELFQEEKSNAISMYGERLDKAQACLHRLLGNHYPDAYWDNVIFVQSEDSDLAEELLDLVPKKHREHYVDDTVIDRVAIVRDYPVKVCKTLVEWYS
jgi:hypothetical protein